MSMGSLTNWMLLEECYSFVANLNCFMEIFDHGNPESVNFTCTEFVQVESEPWQTMTDTVEYVVYLRKALLIARC